jgi:hypothetical protein
MFIDIQILNPIITLKPTPQSKEFMLIDLGKITVKNDR